MKYNIENYCNLNYNKSIQIVNRFLISEKDYLYGHDKRFIRLRKDIKKEAHRVISPLALKYFGLEEVYSATDINGNTYRFDIFEDGNYRVSDIVKLKDYIKEVTYEDKIETDS